MYTYIILDLIIFILMGIIMLLFPTTLPNLKLLLILGIVLCVLTGFFDSIMILLKFFVYNPKLIVGFHIWKAPVEDFAYPVMAAIIVPYLWRRFGKK